MRNGWERGAGIVPRRPSALRRAEERKEGEDSSRSSAPAGAGVCRAGGPLVARCPGRHHSTSGHIPTPRWGVQRVTVPANGGHMHAGGRGRPPSDGRKRGKGRGIGAFRWLARAVGARPLLRRRQRSCARSGRRQPVDATLSSRSCLGGAEEAPPSGLSGVCCHVPPPLPGRACAVPGVHWFRDARSGIAPPVATSRRPVGAFRG